LERRLKIKAKDKGSLLRYGGHTRISKTEEGEVTIKNTGTEKKMHTQIK
jgi:hypothetical protein